MKANELRRILFTDLQPLLPGFRPVVREQALVREFPGGLQRVFVSVVSRSPQYHFSLVMGTRHEIVEELVRPFTRIPDGDPDRQSLTSLTQLGYFFDDVHKEFLVFQEADVRAALSELLPVVHDRIGPFLERMQELAYVDEVLNGEDRRIDISDTTQRTLHALGVARLVKNPRFDELVLRYLRQMEPFLPALKLQVAALVRHLAQLDH